MGRKDVCLKSLALGQPDAVDSRLFSQPLEGSPFLIAVKNTTSTLKVSAFVHFEGMPSAFLCWAFSTWWLVSGARAGLMCIWPRSAKTYMRPCVYYFPGRGFQLALKRNAACNTWKCMKGTRTHMHAQTLKPLAPGLVLHVCQLEALRRLQPSAGTYWATAGTNLLASVDPLVWEGEGGRGAFSRELDHSNSS